MNVPPISNRELDPLGEWLLANSFQLTREYWIELIGLERSELGRRRVLRDTALPFEWKGSSRGLKGHAPFAINPAVK